MKILLIIFLYFYSPVRDKLSLGFFNAQANPLLMSICCKMEHILHSNIMSHFDNFDILPDIQHGFRCNHSCESQFAVSVQYSRMYNIEESRMYSTYMTILHWQENPMCTWVVHSDSDYVISIKILHSLLSIVLMSPVNFVTTMQFCFYHATVKWFYLSLTVVYLSAWY